MGNGGHRLGIDLGTSNTVAALASPNGPVRSLIFGRGAVLSSGVFSGAVGRLITGEAATTAALRAPGGFEANPKRRINDGSYGSASARYPSSTY